MNTIYEIYVYVFNGMSDWEIGYLTAEINSGRYFKKGLPEYKIVTVGMNQELVKSMGGLSIVPDKCLSEVRLEDVKALVLAGGVDWLESHHNAVLELAKRCLEKEILVAAICGATIGMANFGILDERDHTSNDLGYLRQIATNYKGENQYKMKAAVCDRSLITASGIAPVEFSREVLRYLDVFSESTLEAWYDLYKSQDASDFYKLMMSLEK